MDQVVDPRDTGQSATHYEVACRAAGIEFDNSAAHSARYDTERTAELFCAIVNRFKDMGGWDLAQREQGMEGD